MNKGDLKTFIEREIVSILEESINWKYAFGETVRRNGDVVSGNPRDTIDTGETIDDFEVDIEGNRITITFPNDDSSYIFKWREEMGDMGSSSIVEELGGLIGVYIVKDFFEGQGG